MTPPTEPARVSLTFFGSDGTAVGSGFGTESIILRSGTTQRFRVTVSDIKLAPGSYYIGLSIGLGNYITGHRDYDVVMDVLAFEVMPETGSHGTLSKWQRTWGLIRLSSIEACEIN